jgi:hypothetical protein
MVTWTVGAESSSVTTHKSDSQEVWPSTISVMPYKGAALAR